MTPANAADNEIALRLLPKLPAEVRLVLGDQHYDDPAIRALCAAQGQMVSHGHPPRGLPAHR